MTVITEAIVLKLLDAGFTAAQVGLERQAVAAAALAKMKEGVAPEGIPAVVAEMRNQAIAKAQADING